MGEAARKYPEDSDIADLVAEMIGTDGPVEIEIGPATYTLQLVRNGSKPDRETVERSIAGTNKAAGSWKDEDTEEFLEYIYERRNLPPRPAVEL